MNKSGVATLANGAYYFLPLVFFASAFFGGRPIVTLLIMSIVSGAYRACRVIGFKPALYILAETVLNERPNFSHISSMVIPVMLFISALYNKYLESAIYLLHFATQALSGNIKKIKKVQFLYFTY